MEQLAQVTSDYTSNQSEEEMDLRRGPWTVEEDFALYNYIALHGEGRWNSLARCAGLKRTGKSCRLRWLNYLRPDVRRGNITLEEQLLILELHSRWGNRWSKIAQHLPGRTDNEIKNYWRTRVQKHAKQLKCDVNSKQFKDTMRYLWMPRLVERIQAAANGAAAALPSSSATDSAAYNLNDSSQIVQPQTNMGGAAHSHTPENSSAAASSESFGTPECYNNYPMNQEYYPSNQVSSYGDHQSDYFNQGLEFIDHEQNSQWMDESDNLWNVDDMWYLQQNFNNIALHMEH